MVVEFGLAETVEPVVEDNPVDGLHIYVDPPPAVSVTDWPLQIGEGELIFIVGSGLIVTVILLVLEHPLASVPVTV